MIRPRNWPLLCLLGLALAAPAHPAKAQDGEPGFYASLSGMYVVPRDIEIAVGAGSVDFSFDNGMGILGALGYRFGTGLRAEFEIGYRQTDFDELGPIKLDGEFDTLSFMLNGVVDFDIGTAVRPYVGGGFGAVRQKADLEAVSVEVGGQTRRVETPVSESETDIAYQGMIGIGYPLSDRADIHLGYRFFAILEDESYGAHNFEAGVRYRF